MKEFWIYTGLRLGMFVASFVIVAGIWALLSDGKVFILWPLLIAMAISGVGSYYLLSGPRERLALVIEERAGRAAEKFEKRRSKEDSD